MKQLTVFSASPPKILALCIAVAAMVFLPSVHAAGLQYYGIQDVINSDLTTETTIGMQFTEPINSLSFNLDFRVSNLTAKPNFESADCNVFYVDETSMISCSFAGMTEENNFLTLSFESKGRIKKIEDGYQFTANYGISVPVNESFVLIKLPENSVLLTQDPSQSFFPSNGKTGSDGRRITVYWENSNTSNGNMEFSVMYSTPLGGPLFNMLIVSMTGVVIVVMIGLAVYIKKGSEPNETKSEADVVSSVLTADEKSIVDILQENDGKVMQKVIVRETSFSKAKVSRLVKSLSERGVLEVEPMGRTNRIKLKINHETGSGKD